MADLAWWGLWEAELENPRVSEAAMAAMRGQPGFHAALEHSTRGALRLSDADPMLHRLMGDTPSAFLGLVALYLDASGGLTHRRLREVAGISGVLSAGRVSALLMRMQMIGYVRPVRESAPGRPKLYRPTPPLVAAFHARYRLELEALQMMAPDMADLLARYDEPEGFRAFMRVLGEGALRVLRFHRSEPLAVETIGLRQGGGLVLIALLEAAAEQAGHFPAAGPARVSVAALSRRLGVARSHIVRLLRMAGAAGLFARGAREGEGVVRPALVAQFEHVYTVIFVGLAACAYAALRDEGARRMRPARLGPE